MSDRLPVLHPDELSAEQRALYAEINNGRRAASPQLFALTDPAGGLTGPFNAMLFAPQVGAALAALGSAVRFQTALPARVREMAILAVAEACDSDYERYAHEAIGRAAGLTEAELAALRTGGELGLAEPVERAALAAARALARRHDLDDDEFAAAQAALGTAALVELSTLVGYYMSLALLLRVFRVGLPG
jgi:4-carboxymuconolactone decarboxylase